MDKYQPSRKHYELGDGYALVKAQAEEFCRFQAIYGDGGHWLLMNFKSYLDQIGKEMKDHADELFWIQCEDFMVGGAFLAPNRMGMLFAIPPQGHRAVILKKLNELLTTWSDEDKPITASTGHDETRDIFLSLGYKITRQRCAMIRPAYPAEYDFSDEYTLAVPTKENIGELARFFSKAHESGSGGSSDLDKAIRSHTEQIAYFIEAFTKNNTLNFSCCVRDAHTRLITGACLAGKDDDSDYGYAAIADVAVHPAYRRRGLAAAMINRATAIAAPSCPAICLGVTVGNPAQFLYRKLGFVECGTGTSLSRQ